MAESGFYFGFEQFDGFLDQWVVFKRLRWFCCISSTREASIFDLSSGACPSKKLRPSVPIGRTDSLNVRKKLLAEIFPRTCSQIFSESIGAAFSCTRGAVVTAAPAAGF